MAQTYADFVRIRRGMLGLSQRELARRSGIQQPLIAAIESGRRQPSPAARDALAHALELRPSQALAARRHDVEDVFARAGLAAPRIFGSVARGEDDPHSDLDLVVEFSERHDVVDLLALEEELSDLLTVKVDIVDARGSGPVLERARGEARAL